jgi:hypothetical protein
MCFSQTDLKPVEIGSFCYIDSLSKKLVFKETCTVIKKDKFINVAVGSKYPFSVFERQKEKVYKMLKTYDDQTTSTSRKKRGKISAVHCVGLTKTVNEGKTGFKLITGNDRTVDVYYYQGYLVLIFPKLGNETLKSPVHRVYSSRLCPRFINIFNTK